MANLKRLLWHLLGGTRGGPQRIRIIQAIRERPYNKNQLATLLGLDYKTVDHHLRVLVENRVLNSTGDGYGAVFLFTKDMDESLADYDEILRKLTPMTPTPPEATR